MTGKRKEFNMANKRVKKILDKVKEVKNMVSSSASGVFGFCNQCGKRVEVGSLETSKLISEVLVHKGKCLGCGSEIWIRVKEKEIVYDKKGRRIPSRVFVGKKTQKSLIVGRLKRIGEELVYGRS